MRAIQDLPQLKASFPDGREHACSEERTKEMQNEAIARISSETGWRAEDIGPLYRRVFHELEQNAQVHDYLFVLAAKRVKRMLNTRRALKRSN